LEKYDLDYEIPYLDPAKCPVPDSASYKAGSMKKQLMSAFKGIGSPDGYFFAGL
jgi:hypothetical protein